MDGGPSVLCQSVGAMRRTCDVRADSDSDSSDAPPHRWRPKTPPLDESGNPARNAAEEFKIYRASLTANRRKEERGVSPRSPEGLSGETPLSFRTCNAETGAPWMPTTPEQSPSPDNFRDFFRSIEHCISTYVIRMYVRMYV